MRRAVYAGSFDPLTLGHQWMFEKASTMFDEVIVAVGVNPDKKSTFSVEDRVKMLSKATAHLNNLRVTSFENQYLVNYATSVGATFIIRGIRNVSDFIFEFGMQNINNDLNPGVTTVTLMPPRELAEVSSSLVKGLVGPLGWERVIAKSVPPVVLRQMIGRKFQTWEQLEKIGAIGDKFEFWDRALAPYMSRERHYHDWRHIVDMLNLFGEVRNLATDPTAIETAIIFHDIVYSTASKSNEHESAGVVENLSPFSSISAGWKATVARLILATRHNPMFPPRSDDEKILVDLDLAILGASAERFDEYEKGIREEYSWIPDNTFNAKRAEILRGFLDRDRIYYTDHFHEKFGTQAEGNLKRSIEKLSLSTQ